MKMFLLGAFLLAHGLLHASYFTPKPDDPNYPFSFSKGWFADLAGQSAGIVGTMLCLITITAFILAALGVFGVGGLNEFAQISVTIGAVASLLLLVLFWHPWLILGVLIDLILLVGIQLYGWKIAG